MRSKNVFCILPYLKTSEPVTITGITYYPSQSLETREDISEEEKFHLRILFSMFYTQNGQSIEQMLYASETWKDAKTDKDLVRRFEQSRLLIAYFYTMPQKHGFVFLSYENADMFLLNSSEVPKHLVESPELTAEDSPEIHGTVMGYEGRMNFRSWIWTAKGKRIYPSSQQLVLNINQNLFYDLHPSIHNSSELLNLMRLSESDSKILQDRFLIAMDWYNRSCSLHVAPDSAIVYLAIAFESLLGLHDRQDKRENKTQRLADFILGLIGYDSRVDDWIQQFYRARSDIVHEGYSSNYHYYALNNKDAPYGSLISYGRRIFRLCLEAAIKGSRLADRTDLYSSLIHNEERLENIKAILTEAKVSPIEKFDRVRNKIFELDEYAFQSENIVKNETVLGVGKELIRIYRKINSNLSFEIESIFNALNQVLLNDPDHSQKSTRENIKKILSSFLENPSIPDEVSKRIKQMVSEQDEMLDFRSINKDLEKIEKHKELPEELKQTASILIYLIKNMYINEQLERFGLLDNLIPSNLNDDGLFIIKIYSQYARRVYWHCYRNWWHQFRQLEEKI